MKWIPGLWISIILLFLSCNTAEKSQVLSIATAANMQFAMEDLTEAFTTKTGVQTELIIGSSGMLTAQIMAGAPYDILVSADMQYPNHLYEQGYGHQKPEIYGYGQLVLWTCKAGLSPSLDKLAEESISHIAMANPELAPYGKAARDVLIQRGLYQDVSAKLVYGESITQTNQFIRTGAAEIGFTALSVVLSPQLRDTGQWVLLPQNSYSPIAQGILILNKGEELPKNALKFHNFLKGTIVQEILRKYGYLPADE